MTATSNDAVQGALFGDPAPAAPATGKASTTTRTTTQDVELVAVVVRLAQDPGYRVVERSGRVFRVDPASPGAVEEVPRYEADTVAQLLDDRLLELGGNHTISYRGHTGPSRSVLVPKDTRHRVARWANLRALPTPRRAPDRQPRRDGKDRRSDGEQVSGPTTVAVTAPGTALVQCPQFSGQITREGSGYVVLTEGGHRVARTSSYQLGARRLARHHGYRPGPVEVEHRHRDNPPF